MKLRFREIGIECFKSFQSAQLFDLSGYGAGLHFLRGKNEYKPRLGANGVGKSAIWDALCWCLYGKTVRDLRNPDIRPWTGKTETAVHIRIEVDGAEHVLTRWASPNKLLLDDEPIGQEQVSRIFPLSKEVLCHTVLLGQGQPLFLDLSPKEKMNVFGDVLALERWDARSRAASARVGELGLQAATVAANLDATKQALEELTGLLEGAKEASATWAEAQQGASRRAGDEVLRLKRDLEKEQRLLDAAGLAYDRAETEARALRSTVAAKGRELGTVRLNVSREALALSGLNAEVSRLRSALADLGLGGSCPTCGQPLRDLRALRKHRSELTSALADAEKEVGATETAQSRLIEKRDKLERESQTAEKHLTAFEAAAEKAQASLDVHKPVADDLRVKIGILEAQLKDAGPNPHLAQIRELNERIKVKKAETEKLSAEATRLSQITERSRFWVKGFKEVQLYVIEEVLQELELVSNAMLCEMGLEDWSLAYAVERETQSGTIQRGLNVTVISPNNDKPVRWECWSGGESQRLRVVGALALSEVLLNNAGVQTNLEILDEPTRGLSDEGVSDLCAFLADRAEALDKQCWLIDHAAIPSARFTSTLTVVRDRKGSRLVPER